MKATNLVCLTPATGDVNRYVRGKDGITRRTHTAQTEKPMDVSSYDVFRRLEFPPADQEVAGIGGVGETIGWRE